MLAVGTSAGATTLLNFITLQAPPTAPCPCGVPHLTPDATSMTLTRRASTCFRLLAQRRGPFTTSCNCSAGFCNRSASRSVAREAV